MRPRGLSITGVKEAHLCLQRAEMRLRETGDKARAEVEEAKRLLEVAHRRVAGDVELAQEKAETEARLAGEREEWR